MKVAGKQGVITTPHPAATESGARVLEEGGTAIDAMIAASATLAVVFPHMTGLGGDALWLIYDIRVRAIMGYGQAGHTLPEGGIALRGPGAVATTAAALRSWQTARAISASEWGSVIPWSRLLDDAVHWARTGASVSASQAFWIEQRRALLGSLPDLATLCAKPNGDLMRVGDTMCQPQLAASLEHLARAGVDDFYEGDLARSLAKGFETLQCGLTLADLAATAAPEIKPLKVRYREGDFYNFPPPSQGLYTLQAMASLGQNAVGACGDGSAEYYHLLVESIKQGLLARNQELHDPETDHWAYQNRLAPVPINLNRALPWQEPGQPADTIWMAATDRSGRTACLMQSLFHDFGSGCVIGDTGILWQNRAAGFNPSPQHPNAWKPGRRPAHTLNPSCYIADNGRHFFFGSQGGDGQPQTQLVLATQLIDFQKPIDQALAAPRFLLGRSFFDSTDNLKLEAPISHEVMQALSALGHQIESIPALSPYTGQAGIIETDGKGSASAMHDPRGEGNAIALSK